MSSFTSFVFKFYFLCLLLLLQEVLLTGCRGSSGLVGSWSLIGAGKGHTVAECRLGFRLELTHGEPMCPVLSPRGISSSRRVVMRGIWGQPSEVPFAGTPKLGTLLC